MARKAGQKPRKASRKNVATKVVKVPRAQTIRPPRPPSQPIRRKMSVETEAEAWKIIEALFDGKAIAIKPRVAVAKWARFHAKFWLGDANGLITPSVMKGLIDVQDAIFRARGVLIEENDDLRTLSAEDRRAYEIKVKVKKGSTDVSFDINEIASQLGHDLIGKMTPEQVFIAVMTLILIYGGVSFWRGWIEKRREEIREQAESERLQKILDTQKYATDVDLKRFEMLAKLQDKLIEGVSIIDATESGRIGLLKSASVADKSNIGGVQLSPEEAKYLAKGAGHTEEKSVLKGEFRILRVDSSTADGFKVLLHHVKTEQEFWARLRDALLSEQDLKVVQDGEWKKKPIKAVVSITTKNHQITAAVIEEATEVVGGDD